MKLRGLSALLVALAFLALGMATAYFLKSSYLDSDRTTTRAKSAVAKLTNVLIKSPPKTSDFTERKDFNETLVSGERFYTESEINTMTEEQFVELLKTTELKLPRLSDLKELPPGALHTTPAPVIQAGKDLGLLKEVLKVHSSYEKVAAPFYEKCAKADHRPTSIRALCLTNFVEIKKRSGEKVNTKEYPSSVVELTKMITDL